MYDPFVDRLLAYVARAALVLALLALFVSLGWTP